MSQDHATPPPGITDERALGELGRRLARARLDRNLTQAAMAAEAGVSRSTVSRLEAGESTQLTNLLRILRALGLLQNLDALVPPPTVQPLQMLERRGVIAPAQARKRFPGPVEISGLELAAGEGELCPGGMRAVLRCGEIGLEVGGGGGIVLQDEAGSPEAIPAFERILPALGAWRDKPDEIFHDSHEITIQCPRCAAKYVVSRDMI